MKFLVCPDSFKGTMSSVRVAEIISDELIKAGYQAEAVPVADGGEGTLNAITSVIRCEKKYIETIDPLGKKITGIYAYQNDVAYMEYAICCGLHLIKKDERDLLNSTSAGFGILLDDALKNGVKTIYIGIGGSATNDAGVGMLQMLGVKFFDKAGTDLTSKKILREKDLNDIYDFDANELNEKIKGIKIKVLCDVKNKLTGKFGATYIYARQKGAKEEQLEKMDSDIKHFAILAEKKLNINAEFSGAGASGGLGFALKIFLNGEIISGIEGISKILNLEEKIIKSDIVIVGEGSLDYQTAFGKAPWGVASLAKKHNKFVVGISGKAGNRAESLLGENIDSIYSAFGNVRTTAEIRKNSESDLRKTIRKFIEDLRKGNLKNHITTLYN